jgi:hypothetical protein
MGRAGLHANEGSSCTSGFYPDCSDGCFWMGCWPCTVLVICPSLANLLGWPITVPSPDTSPHCAKQNGWSLLVVCKQTTARQRMPNRPLVGQKRCWHTLAGIPIPLPGSGLFTNHERGVAISNSRLISADANTVAFQWKDYRIKSRDRRSVMRLATDEFIRRFLIHVLPDGFHRIRHYGLLASSTRKSNIAKARSLLGAEITKPDDPPTAEVSPLTLREPCPDCGGAMCIIETFRRGQKPQSRAPPRRQAA